MPISVTCECGSEFLTRDDNAGRRAMCPDCGREMTVPTPTLTPRPEFEFVISAPAPVTSRKAIASLMLGLCSLCLPFAGILPIVFGFLALIEIRRGGGRIKGRGKAWAGIVLGAFSILLTVAMFTAFRSAREAPRRAQCVSNLKLIGMAMHYYHDTYNAFPPAAITDRQGRPLLSWRVAILPFMERADLHNKFHLDEPWDSPHNLALLNEMPPVYACPSDPNLAPGQTNYQVIVDRRSIFPPDFLPVRIAGVTDGTANTLLVGETLRAVPWTAPQDRTFHASTPQSGLGSSHSPNSPGFNALLADGSVRWLKPWIAPAAFEALVTRNGNEAIWDEDYEKGY